MELNHRSKYKNTYSDGLYNVKRKRRSNLKQKKIAFWNKKIAEFVEIFAYMYSKASIQKLYDYEYPQYTT